MKLKRGDTIVIATKNEGKIVELTNLLAPYGLRILTLQELNLPEPEEIGLTFKDNALLKAQACADASNFPSLADDSGLSIRALGGQPGVFTSRWAGPSKDYQHAMKKINDEILAIDSHPDRRASFICSIALCFPGKQGAFSFEGKIDGEFVWPARGSDNMGFDPIFMPQGHKKTFAQMSLEEKQSVSHRRIAFQKFLEICVEK
ncbi:MAG: non-canonical purine NTP pyrophosphatase, RdgB/HAM1 family [Alphaproteobacteria bacterium RIFCSPLOWO2_01_FULL_45_8]|nr:MAG: non-canonical purine NTP pyrophosphatase, RdgB/HAM1 family [Alphaproteobacteria bacterium GWB1_45_5]OFW76379.1 MAG: non-canonical purine NTP pyrophosphatase, RdgB/HAM1 family [Alphaproteobacteria bacterium GWA1_45_9]OFW89346.1 MAG: non-canonical purine NTP pyrophosphatase, RdgB/HAM1 family [Alphaproteobacteria bacterium RIFCSPHIGHO2_01_FULL_41_14]OFW95725.1 MAG: non-canonical purine NTP pyrophosphatase, RdgB/HAM1 family [Alphaproteobacteria bacterium RIFCSPLOWO2_01_FULL_45_8]HCI48324.1 